MKKNFILFTVFIGLLFAAIPAFAQDPDPPVPTDNEINAIAKNMYCPVCENVPLDVCGTLACQQWRDEIKDKLSQGWSEDQIYDYFVLKFGDRVLAQPPARGLNYLIYIVPPLVILIGALYLSKGFKTWRKPVSAAPSPSAEDDPSSENQYLSRMEEELRNRKE
ncbi:MAG: cytochrome c-type biogenesis protein CcmH [Chloroflexota bacterium]